jgi:hypothetical protein
LYNTANTGQIALIHLFSSDCGGEVFPFHSLLGASAYGYQHPAQQTRLVAVPQKPLQSQQFILIPNPSKAEPSCVTRRTQTGKALYEMSCCSATSHTTKIVEFRSAEGRTENNQPDSVLFFQKEKEDIV